MDEKDKLKISGELESPKNVKQGSLGTVRNKSKSKNQDNSPQSNLSPGKSPNNKSTFNFSQNINSNSIKNSKFSNGGQKTLDSNGANGVQRTSQKKLTRKQKTIEQEKIKKKKEAARLNKKNQKKQAKAIEDYILVDINGRNQLHRSSFQQNPSSIKEVIKEYINLSKEILEMKKQQQVNNGAKKDEHEVQARNEQQQQQQQLLQQKDYESQQDINCCQKTCYSLQNCTVKTREYFSKLNVTKILPMDKLKSMLEKQTKYYYEYVNELDKFKNTPLLIACIKKFQDQDKKLEGEIEVDITEKEKKKEQNQQKQTHNRLLAIKYLIRFGAKIDICNPRTYWTPFHWCAVHGDKDTLKFLIYGLRDYLKEMVEAQKDGDKFFSKDLCPHDYYEIAIKYLTREPESYNEFLPDHKGKFPIDLAGQRGYKEIVELLLNRTKEVIKENQKNQKVKNQRFFKSPLYLHRCLYWACTLKLDTQKIKEFCSLDECNAFIYVEAPFPIMNFSTPLQIICRERNTDLLNYFLNYKLLDQQTSKFKKNMVDQRKRIKDLDFEFIISDNRILELDVEKANNYFMDKMPISCNNKDEVDSKYSQSFRNHIKMFAEWEWKYIKNFGFSNTHKKYVNYLDQKDSYGNTALHLACINESVDCARILLEHKASIEIFNQEGWRPRELIQKPEFQELFNEFSDHKNQNIEKQIQKFKKDISKFVNTEDGSNPRDNSKQYYHDLFAYGNKLFIPDFVIKFKINKSKVNTGKKLDDNFIDIGQLNRMNQNISHIINYDYETRLLKGIYPGVYYILITCSESKLEELCIEKDMKVKLLDSYEYQTYDESSKTKFEPFRSKQRQQLIEESLKEIINLDEFKKQGLIDQFYKMHTYGGIARIKQEWVEKGKWWWPQPLIEWRQYLLKGKDQNFTALTYLRQYLGEKISFFFAWKSYITVSLAILAFPGLAFQIYIFWEEAWDHWLIPLWVFIVTVWNTVIVEYWKRKSAEINYRWGSLQLMNEADQSEEKVMRPEFVGDECISDITGELTKHQYQTKTLLMRIITIPVLAILMFGVVATFLLVENFKKSNPGQLYEIIGGGMQGISIVILNSIYQYVATKSSVWENLKYQSTYESNMIYKQIIFKLLNSYFSIFYVAFKIVFMKDDESQDGKEIFKTLFFMLLPIMIIKQLNYTLLNVGIPMFLYKYNEKKYFKTVQDVQTQQESLVSKMEEDNIKYDGEQKLPHKNQIEKYHYDEQGQEMKSALRCVLGLTNFKASTKSRKKGHHHGHGHGHHHKQHHKDDPKPERGQGHKKTVKIEDPQGKRESITQQMRDKRFSYLDHQQQHNPMDQSNAHGLLDKHNLNVQNDIQQTVECEVDSIELNSLRDQYTDMINHYADGFVDLGYITLFAAAFPLGPIISMIANCLEIRMKMYVFMYVYQRPTCQNCTGIGEWLNVWEFMSFVSVFSNFALLLFHETQLFSTFFGDKNEFDDNETNRLWFFILVIITLLAFRTILEQTIIDKPPWILQEEERRNSEIAKKRALDENLQKKNTSILHREKAILIKKHEEQSKEQEKQIRLLENLTLVQKEQLKIQDKLVSKEIKDRYIQASQVFKTSTKVKEKSVQELQISGAMRMTYIALERELLIQRIEQIQNINEQNLLMCNQCSKKAAFFECLHEQCEQNYCVQCFNDYHLYKNFTHNKSLQEGEPKLMDKMDHQVKLLRQDLDYNFFIERDYQIRGDTKKKRVAKLNNYLDDQQEQEKQQQEEDPNIQRIRKQQQHQKKTSRWRKFEYFSLPTYRQGNDFQYLNQIYEYFQEEYIKGNGLEQLENQDSDVNIMKVMNYEQQDGDKWVRQNTMAFDMILTFEKFNIEEKLFLNRIAFLTFKKSKQADFGMFLQYCQQLQDGSKEQKILLFLELLDEDDDYIIVKEEIKKMFLGSFIQDVSAESDVEKMINEICGEQYRLDRKELKYSLLYNKGTIEQILANQKNKEKQMEKDDEKKLNLKVYSANLLSFINTIIQCEEDPNE